MARLRARIEYSSSNGRITGLTGGPFYFAVYHVTTSTVLSNEMKVTLAKRCENGNNAGKYNNGDEVRKIGDEFRYTGDADPATMLK